MPLHSRRTLPAVPVAAALSVFLLATAARADGDAAAGAAVFKVCAGRHSATPGTHGINAPSLFGIVGRKAGTAEGFDYSSAMKGSGVTWTAETIAKFLAGPVRFIPGVRKSICKPTSVEDRVNAAAYLHTLKQATVVLNRNAGTKAPAFDFSGGKNHFFFFGPSVPSA